MNTIYKPADINELSIRDIINLNDCSLSIRHDSKSRCSFLGSSSALYSNIWFNFADGRRGIFKTYGYTHDPTNLYRNARMVNEIFLSRLLKELGIPTADYRFAKFTDNGKVFDGVISFDVLAPEEIFVNQDFKQETLQDLFDSINNKQMMGKNIDKNIKEQIFKLFVLDILTMQNDRMGTEGRNLHFIEGKDGYRLCILDSEYAMNMLSVENGKQRYRFDPSAQPHLFIRSSKDGMPIFCAYINQYDRMQQLYEMAIDDPTLMRPLKQVLSLDFKKTLDKMREEGIAISDAYRDYILYATDEMRSIFKDEAEKFE